MTMWSEPISTWVWSLSGAAVAWHAGAAALGMVGGLVLESGELFRRSFPGLVMTYAHGRPAAVGRSCRITATGVAIQAVLATLVVAGTAIFCERYVARNPN